MKQTPILVVWCAILAGAPCAETPNAIFVEILGNAGLYSINYDRMLPTILGKHRVGGRLGFSWLPLKDEASGTTGNFVFPLMAEYQYGPGNHRFEAGAGTAARITYGDRQVRDAGLYPVVSLGYRYVQPGSGSTIRVGLTPLMYGKFMPWVGVSLGRAF